LPKGPEVKKRRHISLILRLCVATAAIIWAFHDTDWTELGQIFRRPHVIWYFALALLAYTVAQLIIAVRWWVLLRAQSIHISVLTAVRLFFLGLFYNNLMPSSVGGDLVKAWYVTKHTHRRLEGVLSVAVDRFVGLLGMLMMAALAYFFFLRGHINLSEEDGDGPSSQILQDYRGILLGAALAGPIILAALVAIPATRARLWHLAQRLVERGRGLLKRLWTAMAVYCKRPITMLVALMLTITGQSMVITGFWLLGRELGIQADLRHYFTIFPINWVIAAIPVSIAGLGVLEAGIIKFFALLTTTAESSAKALALCQRFIWVLASLPGGAIHLLGAHLPKDFFVDVENPVN